MSDELHPFEGPDGQAVRDFVQWETAHNAARAILLIGSRARGQHVKDSDCDLLVRRTSIV